MTTYEAAKPAGMPTWIDLMAPDIDAARAFYHFPASVGTLRPAPNNLL